MKDLISVIVPVYNPGKYFEKCVNSILTQTYNNIELILVDDGSTDGSSLLCDKFAEKDSRIKVIHKENGGAASARNAGLDVATGDYIAFIDADDYIDSDMYESMYDDIIQNDADAARCGIVREYENGRTEEWGTNNHKLRVVEREQVMKDVAEAYGIVPVHLGNKLFKTECVNSIRMDVRFKFAEDTLFNFMVAGNISKMVYHDLDKYHYVVNSSSITNKSINENNFDEHRVMDIIFTLCDEDVLPYAVKGDVLKSLRTLRQMILADSYMDRFSEIRNRILNHKKEIMKSPIYSEKTKQRVFLLTISPAIYKFAIKHLRRR